MSTNSEYIFLTELKKQHPLQHIIVVMDNAPCHRSQILHGVEGLTILKLPAYSPELNPVERFFEEMRRGTANQIFDTLEILEDTLTKAINDWTPEKLKQLTCYEWIQRQWEEVS